MFARLLIVFAFVASWALTAALGYGQGVRGVPANSAEAKDNVDRLIRPQFNRSPEEFYAVSLNPGQLNPLSLRVGAKGNLARIDAKVMQVIDDKSMLVEFKPSGVPALRDRVTVVMVKCQTKGIVDGQPVFSGGLEVTGTTTCKTAQGSKTVFVLETPKPPTQAELDKQQAEKEKQLDQQRAVRESRVAAAEDKRKMQAEARKTAEAKRAEERVVAHLNYAKKLVEKGDLKKAKERLRGIIKVFPESDSAKEAKQLLDELGK